MASEAEERISQDFTPIEPRLSYPGSDPQLAGFFVPHEERPDGTFSKGEFSQWNSLRRAKAERNCSGDALVELVLLLPILVILLLTVIEVGNAINTYLTVVEASQDGARLVVRKGSGANVEALVNTLTERLPASNLTTTVVFGRDNSNMKMVTVEVTYDYQFIFGGMSLIRRFLPNPFQLRASTTMPVPGE